MAILLSEAETEIREAVQDLDTVNPAISQDKLWRVANDSYVNIKVATEDRVADLIATATGLSFAANDTVKTITHTGIRRILHAFVTSTNNGTVPIAELRRLEPWELQHMQLEDSTAGVPDCFGAWRVATTTAADVGKWTFGLWRIPNLTRHIMLRAEVEPTRLTLGTQAFDLTEVEAYALVHASAAIIARRLRRPQGLISELWGRVPEALQAALGRQDSDPQKRPGEPPA